MIALKLPESMQMTREWQFTCPSCGKSRPFRRRVAPRFSRKKTLGYCRDCRSLSFFSIEPLSIVPQGTQPPEASTERPRLRSTEGIAFGITMGAGVGLALGVALDSIALGVAVGAGVGLLLGVVFDRNEDRRDRHEDDQS